MKSISSLFAGVLALGLFLLSVAATTARAEVVVPPGADEDTVTAIKKLFPEGLAASRVAALLGTPVSTEEKISRSDYTAVYRGVRYVFDRGSNNPDLPILIQAGDFAVGSHSVKFVIRDGLIQTVVIE